MIKNNVIISMCMYYSSQVHDNQIRYTTEHSYGSQFSTYVPSELCSSKNLPYSACYSSHKYYHENLSSSLWYI